MSAAPGAGSDVFAAAAPAGRRGRVSSGSSFHYSFGLLPADQRRGIESVYAFCRAIDDLADEGPVDRERSAAGLSGFRREIDLCYGGEPTLEVTRDLQAAVVRFGIPKQPLDDLLDGVETDLKKFRYASFDELRPYCVRVASAVGLVCLPIFGARDPRSREYAVGLGIALQLTNILRDLRADAARGRIYLPLDEMAASGYSQEELLAGARTPAFLALLRQQAERAHRYFQDAARAIPESDRKHLLTAEVMRAIYLRLLRRVERGGFGVLERRISVPRLTQVGLALRAWVLGDVRD